MTRPEDRPEWQALAAHRDELGDTMLLARERSDSETLRVDPALH